METRLARRLKLLITFTETSKKRLIARGFPPEKIKVKYIYEFSFNVPIDEKENGVENNDILFVGTFFKQKGLHIVIEAMSYIKEEIPDARLMIIGRGEGIEKQRIENLIKEFKLTDRVQFLGQKKNEETLKIISQRNLAAVTEQWPSASCPVEL